MITNRNRPWQMNISTILILVALIATIIAWWLDHANLTKQLLEAKKRIQFLETSTYFDSPMRPAPGIQPLQIAFGRRPWKLIPG